MARALDPRLRSAVLEGVPGTKAEIARRMGRKRNDSTVARYLTALADDGTIERDGNLWVRRQVSPPFADYGWPAHFDEAARILFLEKVVSYQQAGMWDDEDREILERYVTSVQVGRLARERIKKRADESPDDPASAYTTRGSQGQLVQHPDLKTSREAERDAQVYEDKLLERQEMRGPADDEVPGGDQAGL